jgi:hypothetical protein
VLYISGCFFKGVIEIAVATRIQKKLEVELPRPLALDLINMFQFVSENMFWYRIKRLRKLDLGPQHDATNVNALHPFDVFLEAYFLKALNHLCTPM